MLFFVVVVVGFAVAAALVVRVAFRVVAALVVPEAAEPAFAVDWFAVTPDSLVMPPSPDFAELPSAFVAFDEPDEAVPLSLFAVVAGI